MSEVRFDCKHCGKRPPTYTFFEHKVKLEMSIVDGQVNFVRVIDPVVLPKQAKCDACGKWTPLKEIAHDYAEEE